MKISLDSWIIQDGNYIDFKVGETRNFALEFASVGLQKTTRKVKECTHLRESVYRVCAEVVYIHTDIIPSVSVKYVNKKRILTEIQREETVVVLDLGNIMVYNEHHKYSYKQGDFVEGEIWIGVDPFFYKECHFKLPEIPKLIYLWEIEGIEIETTPWIKSTGKNDDNSRCVVYKRDKSKISYKEIDQTNAWEDDYIGGSYLLDVIRV